MVFEVHPTPVKGKDGRNIVYVRPAAGKKLSMKALEDYCDKFYGIRFGECARRSMFSQFERQDSVS
jgi:hypothetical protein